MAGLTLARQLKRTHPEYSIVVIDRMSRPLPKQGFKVGESVTEAGAFYLGDVLGLRDYLDKEHFPKLGLRFFFNGTNGQFHERPELGLTKFPSLGSYNMDRGLLEDDLRHFITKDGVAIVEGCSVKDIILADDDEEHTITLRTVNGRTHESENRDGAAEDHLTVRSRWVVDAMGRRRYLQKKLDLTRPKLKCHSAAWFRLPTRIDVGDLVQKHNSEWHQRVPNNLRYYSTNHLMGKGYWVWIIPLSTGSTSIGIVANNHLHPETEYNTYTKSLAWLQHHEPHFASLLEDHEPVDFRFMQHYTHTSRQIFSTQRWACIGDAGFFADPLYSPATDFIALTNSMLTELIQQDMCGNLQPETARSYSQTILALNDTITQNIQLGYSFFHHPIVMAAKILWDTAAGWSLLSPQIFNATFKDAEVNAKVRRAKAGYFFLTQRVQQLFIDWAKKSPAEAANHSAYTFIDYLEVPFLSEMRARNLVTGKSAAELINDQVLNMEKFEELAIGLFLIALEDVYPEQLHRAESSDWLNAWGICLEPEKWDESQLFQPRTNPRNRRDVHNQLRSLFTRSDLSNEH